MAWLVFVPTTMEAQTGQVSLQGRVSATVALSVLSNSSQDKGNVEVVSSGNTLRLTLTSQDGEASVVRLPLLVRSNSKFSISAVFESQTAVLSELSVIDVHPTGTLVSSQAVNTLNVRPRFDLQIKGELSRTIPLHTSEPALVLSGPRISLGGTLQSPNNALEITVVIRLQPQPDRSSVAHLTFVASPEPLIQ
jgi:hypothetical protein